MRKRMLWSIVLMMLVLPWSGCNNGDGDDDGTQSSPPADTPIESSPTPAPSDADQDGYTVDQGDCDDQDASVNPGASEIPYDNLDQDCDGSDLTDVDGDGFESTAVAGGTDCDDQNIHTYPGAPEVGDGKDNDCDGQVDEDLSSDDADQDGFSPAQGDCDDKDSSVYPGATEVSYDGIDQDCSGGDLNDIDGDGYTATQAGGNDCDDQNAGVHPDAQEVPYDQVDQDCNGADLTDVDGDGHNGGQDGDDCDDNNPDRHPGATEIPYDGIDQDCDGTDLTDVDQDTYSSTQVTGGQDCNDSDPSIYPGAIEIPYDKIDQDCSGGDLIDVDHDGYVASQAGGNDCDDNNANTYPGAIEYADGSDNDCDGVVDNHINSFDDDGDGYSEQQGDCNDNDASIHPNTVEVPYDGVDQDCDGKDLTDVDGDGYDGQKVGGSDCDDSNADIHPGATEIPYDSIDQDCTGKDLTDVDGDGYDSSKVSGGTDCNDQDPLINPGGKEIPYDGVDQDCSGKDLTDVDGDGYDGSAVSGPDCNDANAAIYPGATEVCDGVDNNCDKVVDSDAVDRKTWYTDADHDGYGNPMAPVQACSQPSGAVADNTDCDDTTSASHPGATEVCDTKDNNCDGKIDEGVQTTYYQDSDGDGYGTKAVTLQACSVPAGYSANATDCDDTHKTVYPGAPESCDGLDNNCDTQIDEGVKSTFYADADEDGYGDPAKSTQACSAPAGYVADKTDCNDKNADIHPGAAELCNSKDDNCNGQIDDGVTTYTYYQDKDQDGYGNNSVTQVTCAAAPSGYVARGGDCDETNPAINPSATEACNGLDDNCNGQIDDGVKTTYYQDADGDGYGDKNNTTQACSAPAGFVTNSTDCDDTSAAVKPGATETCNGIDDNCNGVVDEGVKTTWYRDGDSDGYGSTAVSSQACSQPSGYVLKNGDCDDTNAAVHPNAAETCNGLDDNCDGQIDEGVNATWYKDADGDSYGTAGSSTQACSRPSGYVSNNTDCNDSSASVNPAAQEICNSIDDDCDGLTDDSDASVTGQKTYYKDADGDGYGVSTSTARTCSSTPPSGYATNSTDCNDSASSINPGATELCNGVDDNCNGLIDDGATCKITLLVWSTGNGSTYTANVAAWLMASGKFSKVDSTDATNVTLSTLSNYDAVLFYTNGSGDSATNGDVLADYAATGKRLVVGTFSWANQGSNTLGGKFINNGVSPFVLNGSSLYTNATIGSKDTSSAFMTGINAITGYYRDAVVLTSGSTSYATWSDGRPLLARKGNVVAVDLFPDDGYGQLSGDYRQLWVNALTVP